MKMYNKLTELGKALFKAVVEATRKLCVSDARPTTMFLDQMKPEIIEVDGEIAQRFKPFNTASPIIIKEDGSLSTSGNESQIHFGLEGHWNHAWPVQNAGSELLMHAALGKEVARLRKVDDPWSRDEVQDTALGASQRAIRHAACGWVMGKSIKTLDQWTVRYLVKHYLNKDVCHFLFKYQGSQWTPNQYNAVLRWLPQLQEMERIGPGLISVWIRLVRGGRGWLSEGEATMSPMEMMMEWRKFYKVTPVAWKWMLTASPAIWRMVHDIEGYSVQTMSDPRLAHMRPTVLNRLVRAGCLPTIVPNGGIVTWGGQRGGQRGAHPPGGRAP